ncbi:MAG: helix-turn-helix domain-containing protein [Cyclobacteriaceae bacterium]
MKNIRKFASALEPISLSWLRYFLLGIAAAFILSLNEGLRIIPFLIPLAPFGYLFLTFYIGYSLLRQQEIYPYSSKEVSEINDIIKKGVKGARSQRFNADELASAKEQLESIVKSEKVYLDPDLGLPQLAAKVQFSIHDLSFVINEGFNENFFEFVNRHRVEEAKRLLKSSSHKHLNILGIAYESGFRSKSTFNATFKKLTGLSPSQFMHSDPAALETIPENKSAKEVQLDNSGR